MKTDKHELITYILEITAKYHKMTVSKLKSKTRKMDIVNARQMAGYLIYKHAKVSMREVALNINLLNPATVIHSIKKIEDYLSYDKEIIKQKELLEIEIDTYILGNKSEYSNAEKLEFTKIGLSMHDIKVSDNHLLKIIPIIELILKGGVRASLLKIKQVDKLEI